jgi:hypothetical protein
MIDGSICPRGGDAFMFGFQDSGLEIVWVWMAAILKCSIRAGFLFISWPK